MGDNAVFGDDHDAVADVIERVIDVLGFSGWANHAIVADARVLIDDGIFDTCVFADADARAAGGFVLADGNFRFEIIGAEMNDAVQVAADVHERADADNAVFDAGVIDDAAVGDDGVIDFGAVHLGAGEEGDVLAHADLDGG